MTYVVPSRILREGVEMTCDIMICGGRTGVMLVDDHQVMRDLLREALENTGSTGWLAQAADGAEELRLVAEAAPDVTVKDVIMLVLDGIEACREITEMLPNTKVLMLTASNEQDAIVRSIAAGATGYLQVSGIQKKMGFRTRQQMTLWAVRAGLVDKGPG